MLSKEKDKINKNDNKLEFKAEDQDDVYSSNTPLKKLKRVKIPKTAQKTIPYNELYENGLIRVEHDLFALVFSFTNINYMLSREDEQEQKFRLYCDVLNSISPDIHYQELIINEAIDDDTYRECLLPKKHNDSLIHQDYIKVQEYFIEESYNATAEKKTYVALSYRVKSKNDNPEAILKKAYRDISLAFRKLDSQTALLKPMEILEIFYNYFNPFKSKEEKFLLPQNFYAKGGKIKDYIAPSSFKFNNTYIEMGTAYTRIFYVKDYPEMLEDKFISDLMDNSYSIVVTKHIEHVDKGNALKFLQKKITVLESQRQERKKKNKREGMDYIPFELQNAIDETQTLFKSLQNDQDMFKVGVYISVSAESYDMLDDICRSINTICRKHMITIDTVTHRQEKALSSVLPLANDKVEITRRMTTSSTAVILPFSAQNIFQPGGFYYGRNSLTNSMVILDRKKLKNGNGFVLGVPGSGKSFKEKREIIDVLELTDDDVIIIDPEREFTELCNKYNGELIKISANTNTYLNPFDINMDYADDEDPIQMKSDFILSIVETLKGSSLSPVEKTIIDRCVRLSYKEFIESGWKQECIPDFTKFYNIVLKQTEQEAKDIALIIELYVIGSLNIFAHKSNVSLNNRLTVIDTKDLGKQLKKLGLLVVLDSVWNILCANKEKGKNTWIITDEFYLFFDDRDGKDSYSADYYYMIYKRSRKYGGMVTGITQNVEDLLQSPKARTMLANSQFIILLDQAPTDRAVLKKLLSLSDVQENFITNAERGCGLMIVGKHIIPIEDIYPKDNEVYKTITTTLSEIREFKQQDKERENKDMD